MAQQTAVDYLKDRLESILELYNSEWDKVYQEFEKAKAMEKEQIINAFGVGCQVESKRLIGYHGMAEQYYNETYNK